jgi:hypothetical protein
LREKATVIDIRTRSRAFASAMHSYALLVNIRIAYGCCQAECGVG